MGVERYDDDFVILSDCQIFKNNFFNVDTFKSDSGIRVYWGREVSQFSVFYNVTPSRCIPVKVTLSQRNPAQVNIGASDWSYFDIFDS